MADTGFKVDTGAYDRFVRDTNKRTVQNTINCGNQIATEFLQEAKSTAPWTDHRGVARKGISATVHGSGRVLVTLGASAPNYKKGPKSSADYMEYLEFDHGGEFAVVTPTFDKVIANVREQYPKVALYNIRYKLNRDKERARIRARRSRSKRRGIK